MTFIHLFKKYIKSYKEELARMAALTRFSDCAVPENICTHFKEGQQKFKGGGVIT